MAESLSTFIHQESAAPAARRLFGVVARLVVAAGCLMPVLARADDPPPALKPPQDRAELEPEEVARKFFIALLTKDKAGIERYILPEENSDVLWEGPPVPEAARQEAHKQVVNMQFKRLKPGDIVKGANGKEYTVEQRQVNEERVLLLPVGFRFPFAVIKQPDGWKVKATAMIAARLDAKKSE